VNGGCREDLPLAAAAALLLLAAVVLTLATVASALTLVALAALAARGTPLASSLTTVAATTTAAVATATATVAATAATAVTSSEAAAAATTTAAGAVRGLVDADSASIELDVVHVLHSSVGLSIGREADKTEASAATSVAVLDDDGLFDLAELLELLAQSLVIGVPRKTSYEELRHGDLKEH
jgi:hypothetical protein